MHAIDFPTCSKNILEVSLYKNSHNYVTETEAAEKIYLCSDLTQSRRTVEIQNSKNILPLETFRRFGTANFDAMCKMTGIKPLKLVYHTNIPQMSEELCQYYEDLVDLNVPRRSGYC